MKKKYYYPENLFVLFVAIFCCVAFMSCGDDDKSDTEEPVKEKSAKELIVGEWHFTLTPQKSSYDYYDNYPTMTFFDNGMFYEHSHVKDQPYDAEPGFYTITDNSLSLHSCYISGSFYDDDLYIKLNTINSESFVFQVDDYVYQGTRDGYEWEQDWAIKHRKGIIGLWSCKFLDTNDEENYIVEFKEDGTFEFANGRYPYTGVYSICVDWIMIYESTGKCPLNGLYLIPNIYDDYEGGYFRLWEGDNSKYETTFTKIN